MKTQQRLNEAFKTARIEYFDDRSRYVFFSDCHRGDGSHSDEFTKNQNLFIYALEYYYANDFTYVEVGDGDELWEQPKMKYIKNAHYDVFEVIKKFHYHDKLIMLYGNHNIFLKYPDYVKQYYYQFYNEYREEFYDFLKGIEPVGSLVLKHRDRDQEIFVVHGHQGDFANDQIWYFTMLTLKYFWRFMHAFGVKNPASPVKNTYKRHKIENNFSKWIRINKKMLICGHTHRYKFPRNGDLPYFNTGSCIYPTTISAIEIVDGEVQLVRWKMRPNKVGVLAIKKEVLRGPKSLSEFDIRDFRNGGIAGDGVEEGADQEGN